MDIMTLVLLLVVACIVWWAANGVIGSVPAPFKPIVYVVAALILISLVWGGWPLGLRWRHG